MKGYVCKVCGFISINGSAPDACPVCHAPKTAFTEDENAIKTPADPKNLNDSEKKHVPMVLILKKCGLIPDGCIDVHVKIGETLHPMEEKHFIGRVDFYIDNEYVSRTYLTPAKLNAACGIHVKAPSGKLSVIEWCNIHGSWIKEVNL